MKEPIRITLPLTEEKVRSLKAGDSVLITGVVYTGRDAAHKRMVEALDRGEELPTDLKDQVIYYVGPTPAKPGKPIGSAGPTTSGRMDAYTPRLLEKGLRGMIGKGYRSPEVIEAIKKYGAVYFVAIGGAAALIAKSIKSYEVIAYEDLGPEAHAKIYVEDFPAIVAIDCEGNNIYEIGPKKYKR
ncbi:MULTISPECIES: Fe-S-containing hydro-lyase [Carboxydothermus]|uniref:Fumarate hydratase, beta subunit n=2 Tax=Carboxydothermus TaxID=129957 RepID=Q3AG00_CARHZ|nr:MULTISPECIES: Fe-S-containing hydro-lyase [Carboxydothermus]ABB14090.1 fumarate hydratase, beta subunit [Carboxydothermus hydrogenoformans Z-2901]NYE57538.1 fumarate hydratase subunit beta [Carboxydothermus ferrireducens DSM 11255]